nr:MAG TPA: hypothetical protein [Microviridae sp.]
MRRQLRKPDGRDNSESLSASLRCRREQIIQTT